VVGPLVDPSGHRVPERRLQAQRPLQTPLGAIDRRKDSAGRTAPKYYEYLVNRSNILSHPPQCLLNAAGFESLGRRFSAGDYKGMTIFALVEQQV